MHHNEHNAPELYDATNNPDIHLLPAQTTAMTPAQFRQWVDAEGDIFLVMLPGAKSFVVKVPDQHNRFFIALIQQFAVALGPEVQAVRMRAVEPPQPPDTEGYADLVAPAAVPKHRRHWVASTTVIAGQYDEVKCTCGGVIQGDAFDPTARRQLFPDHRTAYGDNSPDPSDGGPMAPPTRVDGGPIDPRAMPPTYGGQGGGQRDRSG